MRMPSLPSVNLSRDKTRHKKIMLLREEKELLDYPSAYLLRFVQFATAKISQVFLLSKSSCAFIGNSYFPVCAKTTLQRCRDHVLPRTGIVDVFNNSSIIAPVPLLLGMHDDHFD
jgi:hypothetical protein